MIQGIGIIIGVGIILLLIILIIIGFALLYSRAPKQVTVKEVVITPTATPTPEKGPVYPLRGVQLEYQQVGLISSNNQDETKVMPLYGKPTLGGRSDRWNYYTAVDKSGGGPLWKMPITFENRDCQDINVGCSQIYEGDSIKVPIYKKDDFTATIYKYDL